jgi:hypothetical protein
VTTVLSDGYLLTAVQVPGSYTVTDPVDGPSTGLFYLEVFQGKISGATSHKQVLTDLTSGTEYVRVYVRYTGWSAWTERGTGGGVDTDLTVGNRTATTLDILSSTGADATVPAASETEAGLLSAADKAKLNTIAESADPFVGTDLAVANKTATTLDITSSTGVDVTLPAASTSEAGLMSAADKTTMGTVATAASTFGTTDRLLRSDGTGRGVQASGITISDADAISGVSGLTLNSGSVISFNAGDVTLTHATNALYVTGANQFTVQQGGTYPHTIMERTDTHGAGVATGMISFYGRDSGGTSELYGYIYALANDDTAASEDGSFVFGLPVAGTFGDRMAMTGTALYPTTSDGMALGLSVRMWSDLFLASGGVINFNNGDITLTHASADVLTLGGATLNITGGGGVHMTVPSNSSLRNETNGGSTMYFDVSTGGATHGAFEFRSSSAFTSRLSILSTGVVTVPSTGNLRVGGASNHAVANKLTVTYAGGAAEYGMEFRPAADTTSSLYFLNAAGVAIGSIGHTNVATAYNTTSDYRLKEDVRPFREDAISIIKALSPKLFKFKADPTKDHPGFIAHEVQAIIPNAVTGEKDAVDELGRIMPQGIDHSKLVPHLTAAMQVLIDRVELLENKTQVIDPKVQDLDARTTALENRP